MGRHLPFATALCAVGAVAALSAQALTHGEGDRMGQKLASVMARAAARPAPRAAPLRTSFTERELNAYLKFNAQDQLPKGVVDPRVTIAGDRHVSARAMVNLDLVRTSKPRGWLDPASYLTGTVELKAAGILDTANGKGTFQLVSATVSGVSVPQALLQELVSYYSRSPEWPSGLEFDKPFDLPANIREVDIQRGAATVIQ